MYNDVVAILFVTFPVTLQPCVDVDSLKLSVFVT